MSYLAKASKLGNHRKDGPKASIRCNPFILLFLLLFFLALPQVGCIGTTNEKGLTNSTDSSNVSPSIVTQPTSKTVTVGQSATFSVGSTGSAPQTYQWSRNGTPIIGATLPSYTTPAAVASDNGAQFGVLLATAWEMRRAMPQL